MVECGIIKFKTLRDKALKHTPYCRKTVFMFLRRYGYTVIWHNISYERQGSEKAKIQKTPYLYPATSGKAYG